jgi:type I restriction enzyme S subunit
LGGEHIRANGAFSVDDVKRVPLEFFRTMRSGKIQVGDILVVKDGATTGKVAFVDHEFPFQEAGINEHVFRLAVDTSKADSRYVFRFLQSPRGQSEIQRDFRGATIGGISRGFIDRVRIPLPATVDEQRRIAEILDKADGIRCKRRRAIPLAEEILRSTFLEMFGDPISNPKGWDTEPLGALIDSSRGISYGIVQRGPEVPNGVPVIRISNFVENRFLGDDVVRTSREIADRFRRSVIQGGELLLSIRGTVGRVAIAPVEARGWNVSREVAVIPLLPGVSPVFVQQLLLADSIQWRISGDVRGVAQRGINLSDVRIVPVFRPPEELVRRFDRVCVGVADIAEGLDASESELDRLFETISQRAYRGELGC